MLCKVAIEMLQKCFPVGSCGIRLHVKQNSKIKIRYVCINTHSNFEIFEDDSFDLGKK